MPGILGTINPEVHMFVSKEDSKIFPGKFKSSFGAAINFRVHSYQGEEIQQFNYVEFVVMQRVIAHVPLDLLQNFKIPCRGFTHDPCIERHTHFVPTVFVSYDCEFIQLEALFGERVPFVRVYANGPDRKAIGRIQTYYDLVTKVDKYFSVHHFQPTIKKKKKLRPRSIIVPGIQPGIQQMGRQILQQDVREEWVIDCEGSGTRFRTTGILEDGEDH